MHAKEGYGAVIELVFFYSTHTKYSALTTRAMPRPFDASETLSQKELCSWDACVMI